jgi:hypothetical protein
MLGRVHLLMTGADITRDGGFCRVGKGALARRAHASEALMSHYRRASIEGGLYFFTVTLADGSSDL